MSKSKAKDPKRVTTIPIDQIRILNPRLSILTGSSLPRAGLLVPQGLLVRKELPDRLVQSDKPDPPDRREPRVRRGQPDPRA